MATVAMLGDALHQIAGPHLITGHLIGESVDPHSYRQTRADTVRMARARAIFAIGLSLEAQLSDFLTRLARSVPVSFVGDFIAPDRLITHPVYTGQVDPHIWMSAKLWRTCLAPLAARIADLAPEFAGQMEVNMRRYSTQLAALSEYCTATLETIPPERRVLITAHDAFGYLGRDYGLTVMGIQGFSTQSEAGLQRISSLVDLVVERNIPAIFVEDSVAQRNVLSVIEGARAAGHTLTVGGRLYSDSMGAPGMYEGSYIGMIDHNVTQIARALGGTAPPRGWQGRLAVSS